MMNSSENKNYLLLKYVQDFLIKISEGDYNAKLIINNNNDEQLIQLQKKIDLQVEKLKITNDSRLSQDSIYNGISEILIVLDDKTQIQKTNKVVEKTLLYNESELLNQSIGKLIHKTDFDIVRDCIRNTYQQKKLHETAFNFITKENKLIPVSCSFSPLYNVEGKSNGILLVAKNISSLISAKKQLQDKNDELTLFIYKASHDLKSPVSSIKGVMALLNESQNMEEVKMFSKAVDSSINQLNTIINDLLVLGRITYGELEYVQVNFKQLINEILKSIEFADGFQDINFKIEIDNNAQSCATEKGLLTTIVFNLIDNAIKYRENRVEPSYINIHVSLQDKGILLKIIDNGIGIANSQQANVFKMFYRATSASKGSGLGLYIVKTSVLKLGGTISLESIIGKGTTFRLYLPFQQINPS